MEISPVSSIRFGQYYHQKSFNVSQEKMVNRIEATLQTSAPFDKEGRSYERYFDAMGYDIIAMSAENEENGVKVVVLKQPIDAANKVRREHCEFNYYEERDVAGIYDEEHEFDINDVMRLFNQGQKESRKNLIRLISLPVPLILTALVLGIWVHRMPKQQESKVIEKVVQNSATTVKDTLQMLK